MKKTYRYEVQSYALFTDQQRNFTLSPDEAVSLQQQFVPSLHVSPLADVAFHNFNSAYQITEPRARFLMLMTCLEALFSFGSDLKAMSFS